MINYIIQVMLFQLLFLAIYDLFLRKETFFVGNRIYLLLTPILAFLIPFIKVSSLQTEYTNEVSILLPEIVLSPQSVIENSTVAQSVDPDYGILLFWIGCALLFGLFTFKLFKLGALIKKNTVEKYKEFKLVRIAKTRKAFSFFNYIFLGENISEEDKQKVIEHEMVHSRQKHSADLLLFEILKIAMWYNPLIYIFQKRIAAVHEFISDSSVIKNNQKEQYINTLLNEFFEVDNFSFINQFSKKSILKKRIVMMTKEKSKQMMQAKYLLLLPIFAGMLFYISCSDSVKDSFQENTLAKQKTSYYNSQGKSTREDKMWKEYRDKVKQEGIIVDDRKTYLDYYYDRVDPPFGNRISQDQLSQKELEEYNEFVSSRAPNGFEFWSKIGIYELSNKRKMIATIWDFSMKDSSYDKGKVEEKSVPFSLITKIPTFPGCEENDKDCFNRKIQIHFADNFKKSLTSTMNLPAGMKRMLTTFEIDKEGHVEMIQVKSPSKLLDNELERIVNLLPKMIPGENDGKKVSVKYTLPLRIDVE